MEASGFRDRTHSLWRRWFDVDAVPPSLDHEEPPLVSELRAVAKAHQVFGFQNSLATEPVRGHGLMPVVVENQAVWWIGYSSTDRADETGFLFNNFSGEVYAEIVGGLNELLYRAAVIECVFGSSSLHRGRIQRSVLDEFLHEYQVVPELSDEMNFTLPAIWDFPDVLMIGFGHGDTDVYAGAREKGAFDASILPELASWRQWTDGI